MLPANRGGFMVVSNTVYIEINSKKPKGEKI